MASDLLECFIAIADELPNIQFSYRTGCLTARYFILDLFFITDYREGVIDLHRKVRFSKQI